MSELQEAAQKVVDARFLKRGTWDEVKIAIGELASVLNRSKLPNDAISLSDGRFLSNQAYGMFTHDFVAEINNSAGVCGICGQIEWGMFKGARLHWRYIQDPNTPSATAGPRRIGPPARHPLAL